MTNGTVPIVARAQFKAVDKWARPSVLKDALAMNMAPRNTNSGDSQRQSSYDQAQADADQDQDQDQDDDDDDYDNDDGFDSGDSDYA